MMVDIVLAVAVTIAITLALGALQRIKDLEDKNDKE